MACRAGAVSSIEWIVGQEFPVDLHPSGVPLGAFGGFLLAKPPGGEEQGALHWIACNLACLLMAVRLAEPVTYKHTRFGM